MDGLHRSTIVLLLVRRYGLSVLHHHLLVGRAGSCPLQLVHRQIGPTRGIFISLLEVAYARILDIRLACLLQRRCDRRSSVVSAVGVSWRVS